jgi:pectate lyase
MSAPGFGQRVTGGEGPNSTVLAVDSDEPDSPRNLTARLEEAKKRSNAGQSTILVIKSGLTVGFEKEPRRIRAKNLTIVGEKDSKIYRRLLDFDCEEADNVILRNLTFDGTPAVKQKPTDSLHLDGTKGRGPIGFWIDHCLFNAVFDLSFTANTKDVKDALPLLLTVSGCRFVNDDPQGPNRENNGALGVHGSRDKEDDTDTDRDVNTNAYATICNNAFLKIRRRSPRSSNQSLVHAFNNVLEDWGAPGDDPEQANGMISGNYGLLVAEANYFKAGLMRQAITVAEGKQPGRLTVPKKGDRLENVYVNADEAESVRKAISVAKAYKDLKLTQPSVEPIDAARAQQLKKDSGPKY